VRKQRRTKPSIDIWKFLVREQTESGVSVTRYCREHGIGVRKFYYWKKKIQELKQSHGEETSPERSRGRPRKTNSVFLPVQLSKAKPEKSSETSLTILLKSGHKILAPCSMKSDELKNLLNALENRSC